MQLQRLEYVHGLSYVHKMNAEMTNKMTRPYFKGKSTEIAHQKRIEGNKAFQLKDYSKAVQLYSSAILRAPFVNDNNGQPRSHSLFDYFYFHFYLYFSILTVLAIGGLKEPEPELAMAFANRSAALLHLGDHERALVDIEEALALGNYPTDLRYKLEERRAKCLLALGRPANQIVSACESARLSFKQSKLLLSEEKQPAKRQEAFDREIQRLVDEAQLNSNQSPGPVSKTTAQQKGKCYYFLSCFRSNVV